MNEPSSTKYGMKPRKDVKFGVNLTPEETKRLIKKYFEHYPALKLLMSNQVRKK